MPKRAAKRSKPNALRFYFTKHAIARMFGRNITKKRVVEAVVKAQKRKVQQNGNIQAVYTAGQTVLHVVYSEKRGRVVIITTW